MALGIGIARPGVRDGEQPAHALHPLSTLRPSHIQLGMLVDHRALRAMRHAAAPPHLTPRSAAGPAACSAAAAGRDRGAADHDPRYRPWRRVGWMMLFERFESSSELVEYKLGSALKMERDVLKMLDRLEVAAHGEQLKQHLRRRAEETRQHAANVERAFAVLGREADDKPCPVLEAIDKEGRAQIKRADDRLTDDVILAAAAATEHYEIAVYEWLLAHVDAMGKPEAVALLQQNLEQEQHALVDVMRSVPPAIHASAS
jgi:ferritin-like metal-binding protein YciE